MSEYENTIKEILNLRGLVPVKLLSDKTINSIQELVDRATPNKPVIDIIKFSDKPCEIYHCACDYIFIFKNKFCPNCGQAIDWSEK